MTGTPSQIEWAEQIKLRIDAEFDRVASALMAAACTQMDLDRVDSQSVIAILKEKRRSSGERSGPPFHPGMAGIERSGAADDQSESPVPGDQGQSRGAPTMNTHTCDVHQSCPFESASASPRGSA